MAQKGFVRQVNTSGSALILTVVLTTLMAIVGAMFLFSSRIEKLSTSYLMDKKELNIAVDELVGLLSNRISNDVPGVAGAEYYDYAGTYDTWLASNAPYFDGTGYYWPQISDVNGYFATHIASDPDFKTRNVDTKPMGIPYNPSVISPHREIELNDDGSLKPQSADADGDGIADSKWFAYRTTGKGQMIYAAMRVIDNGGMINLNTAYEFDPNGFIEELDGSLLIAFDADRP